MVILCFYETRCIQAFRGSLPWADRLQNLRNVPNREVSFSEVNIKSKSALPCNHVYSHPKLMNKATLFYQLWLVKIMEICIKTIDQNGKQTHSFFISLYHFSSLKHKIFRCCFPGSPQLAELEFSSQTPLDSFIIWSWCHVCD